jgi:hypothetical protein
MNFIARYIRHHETMVGVLRPWLVFVGCAGTAIALIATSQRASTAMLEPPVPIAPVTAAAPSDRAALPHTEFAPTFADAAASLRHGRYADAYGRFVRLADEGDIDAARVALVMHALGPRLFGSAWDATAEQLMEWTRWSDAAAAEELAQLRAALQGPGASRSPLQRPSPSN